MKIGLRRAIPTDLTRLKELWRCCFGDEEGYINLCFDTGRALEWVLVLETENTVRSMLLVFPQELTLPQGERVPVWYVYAFCTHPESQGKGYGRRLLAWAEECAAQAGAKAVMMVPGEPSLFRFYEQLGYETACFTWEIRISRGKNTPPLWNAERCDTETYNRLRETLLAGTSHITYPAESLAWQEMLCSASGGGLYHAGTGIAVAECWGGNVVCKELLAPDVFQAAQAVLVALGAEEALVRTVPPAGKEPKPFGVIRWLDGTLCACWNQGMGRYLALAFD